MKGGKLPFEINKCASVIEAIHLCNRSFPLQVISTGKGRWLSLVQIHTGNFSPFLWWESLRHQAGRAGCLEFIERWTDPSRRACWPMQFADCQWQHLRSLVLVLLLMFATSSTYSLFATISQKKVEIVEACNIGTALVADWYRFGSRNIYLPESSKRGKEESAHLGFQI